jgi:hypothetical protein
MKADRKVYGDLARVLLRTWPDEVTCEEWLDRIGECAEIVLSRCPFPSPLSQIQQHMDTCPECAEEFESILVALCDER